MISPPSHRTHPEVPVKGDLLATLLLRVRMGIPGLDRVFVVAGSASATLVYAVSRWSLTADNLERPG
jgi:hypothetical protein